MFLDERFTHQCSLRKRSLIRFADRSVPKTLDIFQYESTANDVCISCMRFERIKHSVCADFAPQKSSTITTCYVLISQTLRMRPSQKVAHA